jgi:hypothetical protein
MNAGPSPRLDFRTVTIGAYLIVLNLFLVYVLVKIWPGTIPFGPKSTIYLFWGHRVPIELWVETRYLLIVVIVGALGSYIHLATSFADFIGNRQFASSWQWWYLLRPFIGLALAVLVYFAVRGGLIAGNASADSMSPYGVAAFSGLAGLFSKQATDKLREVFENLFKTTPPPRKDALMKTPEPNGQTDAEKT